MRRTSRSILLVLGCLGALATPAAAAPETAPETGWLDTLTTDVIADLAAGKPLVAEVHVPLCDSSIIPCGNARLGDGDNPKTNLYWATGPGFGVWFGRRGSGWKLVEKKTATSDTGDADILERLEYARTITSSAAWRKHGAPKTFELHVIIHAWRGTAIDRALDTYAKAVSGASTARIVAFVGHNRLMDLEHYTWPTPGESTKGTIAIACHTAAYMQRDVPAPTRVPLLMTNDFLFSNAAPLDAAVLAFARGEGYATIRRDAVDAYALVQKATPKRVNGVFTNPGDSRWAKRR